MSTIHDGPWKKCQLLECGGIHNINIVCSLALYEQQSSKFIYSQIFGCVFLILDSFLVDLNNLVLLLLQVLFDLVLCVF